MNPPIERSLGKPDSPGSRWLVLRARLASKAGAAWLIGVGVVAVASIPLGAFLSSPGRTWEGRTVEDFNSGHLSVPLALDVRGDFRSNQDGWYLPAGAHGELRYRIGKTSGKHVTAQLWLYVLAPSVVGELEFSSSGTTLQRFANPYFAGELIDLTEADSATSLELALSATNAGRSDVLVFDQLIYGFTSGPAPPRPTAAAFLAFGALSGIVSLPLLRAGRSKWLIATVISLLVAAAATDRFDALFVHSSDPLDPDAIGYRIYADRFAWWPPWESGIFSANFGEREPFFPLVVRIYFDVSGSSDFQLRVVSSTLSLLAVPLTLVAARRQLSWLAALVVAALVAFNRPLVDESFRGLRTELELCLVLGLYLLLDHGRVSHARWQPIFIGLVGTALVLTRTFYLPMIIVGISISFLAQYRPVRRALLPLVVAVVLVIGATAGHRLAMYERLGDAFYDTAGYARWNANIERFQRGVELPHPELFPTEREYVEHGPYFGPRITYAQYLFELHTLQEVVAGTAAGFADVFANTGGAYVPGIGRILGIFSPDPAGLAKAVTDLIDQAVKWLGVLGLVGLLVSAGVRRRPQDLLLPAMLATGLASTTFLYHLQLIERYRNTMQFYPFLAIAGAWLVQEMIRLALRRRTATGPLSGGLLASH